MIGLRDADGIGKFETALEKLWAKPIGYSVAPGVTPELRAVSIAR